MNAFDSFGKFMILFRGIQRICSLKHLSASGSRGGWEPRGTHCNLTIHSKMSFLKGLLVIWVRCIRFLLIKESLFGSRPCESTLPPFTHWRCRLFPVPTFNRPFGGCMAGRFSQEFAVKERKKDRNVSAKKKEQILICQQQRGCSIYAYLLVYNTSWPLWFRKNSDRLAYSVLPLQ